MFSKQVVLAETTGTKQNTSESYNRLEIFLKEIHKYTCRAVSTIEGGRVVFDL